MNDPQSERPKISVVLNFNGKEWLTRCFESLKQQTIFPQIEVIFMDNNSADGAVKFSEGWLAHTAAKGRVVQNGANLFYCGANNNRAATATDDA